MIFVDPQWALVSTRVHALDVARLARMDTLQSAVTNEPWLAGGEVFDRSTLVLVGGVAKDTSSRTP